MIKVDLTGASEFFSGSGPDYAAAAEAHRLLVSGTGAGSEFTGWLQLPTRIKTGEMKAILNAAERIRSLGSVLLVIGIGGSYLGARAAIELLKGSFHNQQPGATEIYFLGNTLSPDAINEIYGMLGDRDFCVNVISKSGGTLEPALGFRSARELLEGKYSKAEIKKRLFVTTDSSKGILHGIAVNEGYEMFTVPDDVGGRYSVLSAVGLLPMAVAGIDITKVIDSAEAYMTELVENSSPENAAWQYAAARQHLYGTGKSTELLACYEPSFRFFAEWWKQLYGESEGKNGIGIYPASVEFNADLHSMGQFIQDGPRTLMETVVTFEKNLTSLKVPFSLGDPDGLNYLAGKDFGDIRNVTVEAVKQAHISGGVPNIGVSAPARDEEGLAQLIVFFEFACGISAYMSGVNPFNQPGVEAYKKNMFRMLQEEK